MRIISGKYRSRSIKAPNPKFTRPTTDKVKETLFNILNNRIDFDGSKVLDLYAGSGSLGLEALSRGAKYVHFVENNFGAMKVLQGNIASLGAEESCRIFKSNAKNFSVSNLHENYDLIFADPPFFKDDIHIVFYNIIQNKFLQEAGHFIIERSIQTREKDVKVFGEPFKQLGDSLIYWYVNS